MADFCTVFRSTVTIVEHRQAIKSSAHITPNSGFHSDPVGIFGNIGCLCGVQPIDAHNIAPRPRLALGSLRWFRGWFSIKAIYWWKRVVQQRVRDGWVRQDFNRIAILHGCDSGIGSGLGCLLLGRAAFFLCLLCGLPCVDALQRRVVQ